MIIMNVNVEVIIVFVVKTVSVMQIVFRISLAAVNYFVKSYQYKIVLVR